MYLSDIPLNLYMLCIPFRHLMVPFFAFEKHYSTMIVNFYVEKVSVMDHLNTSELSPEELTHIIAMRQKKYDQEQARLLYPIVAQLFAKWSEYKAEEGMGLTFSVFLDDFKAEEKLGTELPAGVHIRQIYDLMAALDQQLSQLCRALFRVM